MEATRQLTILPSKGVSSVQSKPVAMCRQRRCSTCKVLNPNRGISYKTHTSGALVKTACDVLSHPIVLQSRASQSPAMPGNRCIEHPDHMTQTQSLITSVQSHKLTAAAPNRLQDSGPQQQMQHRRVALHHAIPRQASCCHSRQQPAAGSAARSLPACWSSSEWCFHMKAIIVQAIWQCRCARLH